MRWLFLFIFIAYMGIHGYAYARVAAAWALPPAIRALLGLALILMMLAPLLVRRLGGKYPKRAAVAAWIGYTWMGFIFLFFFISLSIQTVIAAVYTLVALMDLNVATRSMGEGSLAVALSIGLLLSVYAFWRASRPRLVRIPVRSTRLPPGLRLRLVQISDLHLGLLSTRRRLKRVVRLIRSAAPDCLVSTGDFTDLRAGQSCPALAYFTELKVPLGKYAVTGNHECYAGLSHSEQVLQAAAFTLLRQRCITLEGGVQLAGVDDPVAARGRSRLEEKALHKVSPKRFTVLLKHRPELEPATLDRIDLQLSGHTHDGQIFPFTLLPRLLYRARPGLARFGRTALYLSRGTGAWGPPMRFPFPPEVTLFEIEGTR